MEEGEDGVPETAHGLRVLPRVPGQLGLNWSQEMWSGAAGPQLGTYELRQAVQRLLPAWSLGEIYQLLTTAG